MIEQSSGVVPAVQPTPVIAIFDIGKTNKKLFLFDFHYQIVWEQSEPFPETVDEDGDPCEDINLLTKWVHSAIYDVLTLPQFDLKALNFTTYGASFVYLDAEGRQIGQLYNYLKPFPAKIREKFLKQYGPAETLSRQTASPWLDSLNSGLMLYRIKYTKPRLYRRIWYALHLPQYISYLITRRVHSDLTSIGCHTMLWDFTSGDYHSWVKVEGFDTLMGNLFPADRAMNPIMVPRPVQPGERRETQSELELRVGVGLHDSSAALIPYLTTFQEPFILISTGTWCISLNPFIEAEGPQAMLTPSELSQDCLYYMHYRGKPVKASRLFAGYEHEQQTKRLALQYGVPMDYYKQVSYDSDLVSQRSQLTHATDNIPTASDRHTAQVTLVESAFGDRSLEQFPDYETAYHQLMIDLIAEQKRSTTLVLPQHGAPVTRIFVDGGFSQNPVYMNLLALTFPQVEVWAASIPQTTAMGAALAFHDQWNPLPVPANLITLTHYAARPTEHASPLSL